MHLDPCRNRCLVKGRRGGGTTSAAFEGEVEVQLWGGGRDNAGIGVFAPNVKKTELLYGMIHDSLIRQTRFGRSQIRKATWAPGNRVIETTWDARIAAFSLHEESPGEGEGFRLALVDETQLINWQTWWTSIRPTLSDLQGRALFVGKAAGAGFRRLDAMALKHPNTWGSHHYQSVMNPIMEQSEIDEAKAEMPEWMFQQEYMAQFQDFGDAVFANVELIVDDDLPVGGVEYDPALSYVAGCDLAKKQDRTVILTLCRSITPHPVVNFWRGYKEPWPIIQNRIELRQKDYSSQLWIDETGIGDAVIDNLGVPIGRIHGYVFTPKSKSLLVSNLQKMIEDGAIRIPRIPQLIKELEEYRWEDDQLETDCVMALALAAWGVRQHRAPRARRV